MSITYPALTETSFPDAVDSISRMSDLSQSDLSLVSQYYEKYNAGDWSGATAILDANPYLKNKIFNASKFNRLADGMVATQKYFIEELQNYLNYQLTYKETYNNSTRYIKTNIVDYNGECFICRVDSSIGVAPENGKSNTNWAIIAKRGIQGVSGIGLSPRGLWSSATQYYANDCVSHNNILWQSLTQNTASEPSESNTTNWLNILNMYHLHGNITSDGRIGTVPDLPVFTGADGKVTTRTIIKALAALGIGFAICSTPAVDKAKTAQWDGFNLSVSSMVGVLFTNGNTHDSPTLNISSTAHAPMYCYGAPVTSKMITKNMLAFFIYDGSQWQLINPAVVVSKPFAAQSTAPSNTEVLWIDTANDNIMKFYDGFKWTTITATWG